MFEQGPTELRAGSVIFWRLFKADVTGVEVTAGDWPLGGRLVRLSEDMLTGATLVGFLLTSGMGLRSLPQSDKDIQALHRLSDSPKRL